MSTVYHRPSPREAFIRDPYCTDYLRRIFAITLPDVLTKFEKSGYLDNFRFVAEKKRDCHIGPPFSDGLVYETLRGAFDFLVTRRDPMLERRLDGWVELIINAIDADRDGYICTNTTLSYPERRWGENGGDIIIQHDLYNHGALVEAAISRYLALGRTDLLSRAVKSANLIVSVIGEPPRLNIVPGHSLPEEAFIKLGRLFRDHTELAAFARDCNAKPSEYMRVATFWLYARGRRDGRTVSPAFSAQYNQDHLTFSEQKEAVGHAVRASLLYTGAAAAAYETGNLLYIEALDSLWENVARRKLHITGGIGTRHDIEGFDSDYNLPDDAYLETCAAVGFAFWNGEMSLLKPRGEYFDCFERSLYNNIAASISTDFTHYYYQNPLVSGGAERWEWHGCPCCPPMLLKLFSNLQNYVYIYTDGMRDVYVNLLIRSELKRGGVTVSFKDGAFSVTGAESSFALHIRVPEYAVNYTLTLNGEALDYEIVDGYAIVDRVWLDSDRLAVKSDMTIRRVFADSRVKSCTGRVAVTRGPFIYCAEGIDNGGEVDFTLAEKQSFRLNADKSITASADDGRSVTLIPYYRWSNRAVTPMRVWLKQESFDAPDTQGKLYGYYDR